MLKNWLEFLTRVFAGSKIQVESDRVKISVTGLAAVLIAMLAWRAAEAMIHDLSVSSPRPSATIAAGTLPPRAPRPVAGQGH